VSLKLLIGIIDKHGVYSIAIVFPYQEVISICFFEAFEVKGIGLCHSRRSQKKEGA
jgi:hypothetical protein